MRRGIEKLAYLIAREPSASTMGELADKFGEPVERIMDACDVIKVVHGEPTQFPPVPWGVVTDDSFHGPA